MFKLIKIACYNPHLNRSPLLKHITNFIKKLLRQRVLVTQDNIKALTQYYVMSMCVEITNLFKLIRMIIHINNYIWMIQLNKLLKHYDLKNLNFIFLSFLKFLVVLE